MANMNDSGTTPQFFDNSEDLNALLELRDIQDELNTISKLLGEQHNNIRDMTKQYQESVNERGKGIHGTVLLREADHAITVYEEQVNGMIKSSQVAENAVSFSSYHSNINSAFHVSPLEI